MNRLSLRTGISAALTLSALTIIAAPAGRSQTIPSTPPPKPTCTVSQSTFNSWFASGTATVNGLVDPANSIAFQPSSNCAFYTWSEQMFMWLTSPAPSSYGGTGPVFDSNTFYQVVPGTNGSLNFLGNPSLQTLKFGLRAAQVGPNGLPVILDNKNVMHEVKPTQVNKQGQQLIAGAGGKLTAIKTAKFAPSGAPILLDTAGKQIKPQLAATLKATVPGQPSFVQKILIGTKPVFFDMNGFPIPTDQGQAGDGAVLIGAFNNPPNALVYYATFVNDVFAWYLTQVKNTNGGTVPANTFFPTTQAELNSIIAYAQSHGARPFPDPNALAMEVKTSWVNAAGLDTSQYVTINAEVPVYTPNANNTTWSQTGFQPMQLALVGIHVVGSLTNHPEMAWSTFEHFGNTPNGAYSYIAADGSTVPIAQNTNGSWLFCTTNCSGTFNNEMQTFSPATTNPPKPPQIVVAPPATQIGQSNTLREKAWGASDVAPNPLVSSAAESNTDIISINTSVLGWILNGDVRKNYFMIGSTWTSSGAVPNGAYSPSTPTNTEIGTSQLMNSTMETYQQGVGTTYSATTNCFGCHKKSTNTQKTTVEVSHIFDSLNPLPTN